MGADPSRSIIIYPAYLPGFNDYIREKKNREKE